MKIFLVIVLGVLIGGGLYVYLDPALKRQTEQQMDRLTGQDQAQTLYRWQDNAGQWQISDQPPPAGIPYETLHYDPGTNVIPSQHLTGQKND